MSDGVFVRLASIFSYLKANAESRCIVEGEELLNANHIILIGTTTTADDYVDILALCLQTTALKSSPHEIKGKLVLEENKANISDFKCSCKAGLSGTCKHIAAVLLKCTRSSISSLEKLSSTDIKCYWNNRKREVEEEYEAKPIIETPCFMSKASNKNELTTEQAQECFKVLSSICPESSVSCHLKGRSTHVDEKVSPVSPAVDKILTSALESDFLASLNVDVQKFNLKPCCSSILKDILDPKAFKEAVMCSQKSEVWYQERQFRLTGSRCYSIYTYSKENWEHKAKSYFWPKKFSNKYVEHGMKYENLALKKYSEANNYHIIQMGLMICQQYPWLAYSPDGVVMSEGVPTRLVEIKCPYDGITNDAITFVHTCSYLEISRETGLRLKKNHTYYGQVQLGMAILNLKVCDLILYSSKSNNFLNVSVPFDEEFAKEMIYNITDKYFINLIHFICEKRDVTPK